MQEIFKGILEWNNEKIPQRCYGIVKECPKCKRRIFSVGEQDVGDEKA